MTSGAGVLGSKTLVAMVLVWQSTSQLSIPNVALAIALWHNDAEMVTLTYVPPRPIQEVAQAEGVSVRQLYRWIEKGKIAKYQRGGDKRTFVDPEQVRQLLGFRRVS